MSGKCKIIEPHGFCMGVNAAIKTAFALLNDSDLPVYCLHELVHNECVVSDLKLRGMQFVESLAEIPEGSGAVVLFSAHGVSPEIRSQAERCGLKAVDATCPFVARVHRQVRAFAESGRAVVVIGHADHVEVRGVADEARAAGARVAVVIAPEDVFEIDFAPDSSIGVVCQTTLDGDASAKVIDALRSRFADVETTPASDVCTATRDRQNAVKEFVSSGGDGVVVLGSVNSSNTKRLAETAEKCGAHAWRIGNIEELKACDFSGVKMLGVTSGASTPESFFEESVCFLNGD